MPMNPTSRSRRLFSNLRLGLGVLCAATWSFATADAAPNPTGSVSMNDWLEKMGAHYEAHPELKQTKGSGWKPYNRFKWFYEQRMLNGEDIPVGARWNAVQQKLELERNRPAAPRASWFSLGPNNFGGRMLDIEFDPNTPTTIYAAAAGGGLFKSTNNGVNWFPVTDEIGSLAVGAVCVLPSDPNIVLIGTGEATFNIDRIGGVGILRSTDAGTTWNTTSLSLPASSGHGFHVMEVNPLTGTILAGATDGLWRSSDNGQNWTQVRVGDDHYDVAWKPGSSTVCYAVKGSAGSGNGLKVSTNDGLTFVAGGAGGPLSFSIGKSKLSVTAADPARLYIHYSDQSALNSIGTYLSTNDGVNVTLQSSTDVVTGQGWYNLIFAADPNSSTRLIAGGVPMFRSTNAGVSWSSIGGTVHVDHHALRYKPGSPDEVWVCNDGGVYQSTNDGTNWTVRNTDLVTYQFYDICVSQQPTPFIMGGTQDNGTDKWSGSTTWAEGLGADGMVCNINPNNGTTVYAEIQFGDHRRNTNSGIGGWQTIMTGIPANNQQWVVPVAEDQVTGNHLYTSHSSGGIYRTSNGGTNWTNVATHTATWIDISPVNGNYVFTVTVPMRYTTDDGATWATAAGFPFPVGGVTKVACDPIDVNTVYVTFSSYASVAHVAKTTDLGATWTDISGNLPSIPVNAIAVDNLDPSDIYVGTDVGVWSTTDGGANWAPFEIGLPNTVVVDLEIRKTDRKLIAGTHGRGAWEVDINGATDVSVVSERPLNLMFDPPSPNPVSKEAVLRFAAKHQGEVTLSIYDLSGRLVNEIVRVSYGDGIIKTARWETDDVPSGVYFAVLKAGSSKLTQKIVVAK